MTDVDGTLTNADRRLDLRAADLVRRLERRGSRSSLPPGTSFRSPSGSTARSDFRARSWRRTEGSFTTGTRADANEWNGSPTDAWPSPRFGSYGPTGLPVRRLFTDRWRESEVALEPNVSVAAVRRVLGRDGVEVESTGYALHLMESGGGKLPALVRSLAPLGLTPQECVILGDGDNDVAMLRAAGFGVSFPSASPRARRAARYVTRATFAAGFVEGLKTSGILD